MSSLQSSDLVVDGVYSGKRDGSGTRKIVAIHDGQVKYSGSTLAPGHPLPVIPVWQFLFWAKECIERPAVMITIDEAGTFPQSVFFGTPEPEKPFKRKRRRFRVRRSYDEDEE